MTKIILCNTQDEFNAAVSAGDIAKVVSGFFEAHGTAMVTASGNAKVTARGNATVAAYDNATVTASDNATVTACDTATVRASDNATVTAFNAASVTASGNVFARLFGPLCKITAEFGVVILRHNSAAAASGGTVLEAKRFSTPVEWCHFYGVTIDGEFALVYKAVKPDFKSPKGADYSPGATPEATDWDEGVRECGGGLHFSPTPWMARRFIFAPARFVACWVRLDEMAVHPNGEYPEKCKARRVAKPCYEVNEHGDRIA